MRARLALLTMVVAITAAGPGVRSHAAGDHVLTLEGRSSSSIDLNLASDTSFDLRNLVMAGPGRFVGFYAEPLDKPISQRADNGNRIGAVRLRDWHPPGEPGLTLSFGPPHANTLSAGRYRFYLLADGPSRVTIPTDGSLSGHRRPMRPASVSVATEDDILTSSIGARNVQPITLVGARNVSFSALLVGKFRAYVGDIGACIRRPESECGAKGIDGGFSGFMISPLGDADLAWIMQYKPGAWPGGHYEAFQGATNATTLQYASGAAFSLSLS